MKVHNDLKELLEDFLTKRWQDLSFKGMNNDDVRFIESYSSSNSLALGKPEPLAKNKQTDNNFWCVQKELDGGRCVKQCKDCEWHGRYD